MTLKQIFWGLVGVWFILSLMAVTLGDKPIIVLLLPIFIAICCIPVGLVFCINWLVHALWDLQWSYENKDNCLAGFVNENSEI